MLSNGSELLLHLEIQQRTFVPALWYICNSSIDNNISISSLLAGSAPTFPVPVQVVEVEVKLEDNADYDSKSEDEG